MELFNKNKKKLSLVNDDKYSHICEEFIGQLVTIYQEVEEFTFDKYFYDYIESLILSKRYFKHIELIKLSCMLKLDTLDKCDMRTTSIQEFTLAIALFTFSNSLPVGDYLFEEIVKIILVIVTFVYFYRRIKSNSDANKLYQVLNATIKCIEQIQIKIANY